MAKRLDIQVLGSGSRGNATVIRGENGGILIDAGFSRKELVMRMRDADIDPAEIRAVVITHEHDDHIKGCRVFCDHFGIPVYVSVRTAEYLAASAKLPERVFLFSPGVSFAAGGFGLTPFLVQHDAVEPVGFVVTHGNSRCGVATDLGQLNNLARMRLRDCDVLILESNYDCEMLHNSDRSYRLKHRIMGRHGHLDNKEAMESLEELLTERTQALYLVHISSECNRYELVRELAAERLRQLNRLIAFHVVEQDMPAPGFCCSWEES